MASTRAVFVALLVIGIAGCPGGGNPAPTIVSFTCTSPLPFGGGPVTLAWNVNGAVTVSIDNNVGVVNPPTSGSTSVNVTGSTTFTLTATGSTGSSNRATKECLVVVNALTISSFTATPSILPVGGGPVTLAWNVKAATSLSIDNGVGQVTPVDVGSKVVQVTTTTTFMLTATNANGSSTATVGVTVPKTPPVINSFTATPSSLPTGGGQVKLAWDVTGANSLSIDQNVGSVSPNIGSITVLVSTTTTFTLTATDPYGMSTATALVTVTVGQAIETVNGTVVDENGQPIAGETVLIVSDGGTVTAVTDGDGGFTVPNVQPPYNATVIETAQAVQYQGLTRTDPSLSAFVFLPSNRTATLSGTFTGSGVFPEPSGYSTGFLFVSPQAIKNLFDHPTGSYSSTVTWPGPTSTTGTVYALQKHTDAGLPTDYPGYGSLSGVVLQDTGTLTGQNVPLSPVTSGLVSGSVVSVPSGYTLVVKSMSIEVTSGVTMSLLIDGSPSATFSYVAPSIANTQIFISATATSAAGEVSEILQAGLAANVPNVTLAIPAAPVLSSPSNAATGVTGTTAFSWTPFPSGIHEFVAYPQSGQTGPTFYVVTAATTVDLADAGLPLPSTTGYNWYVVGLSPVTTVDIVAAPGGLNRISFNLSDGVSAARTFTTGP